MQMNFTSLFFLRIEAIFLVWEPTEKATNEKSLGFLAKTSSVCVPIDPEAPNKQIFFISE